MQDFNALEGKSLAELREIGRALGVGNVMLKKKELLEQIRAVALVAGQHSDTEPNAVPAEEPKRRGRRPRMSGVKVEGRSPAEGPEVPAETETTVAVAPVAEEQPVEAAAVPKRRGRKPKSARGTGRTRSPGRALSPNSPLRRSPRPACAKSVRK